MCGLIAWSSGHRLGGTFARGYGWWMAVGLALSALGDINLELSPVYPVTFKIGLVSFLLGALRCM